MFRCAASQCPDETVWAVNVVVYVFKALPPPASNPMMPNATTQDLDQNRAAEMLSTIPFDIPHYWNILSKKKMVLLRAGHMLHDDSFEKAEGGGGAEERVEEDESWWQEMILEA